MASPIHLLDQGARGASNENVVVAGLKREAEACISDFSGRKDGDDKPVATTKPGARCADSRRNMGAFVRRLYLNAVIDEACDIPAVSYNQHVEVDDIWKKVRTSSFQLLDIRQDV